MNEREIFTLIRNNIKLPDNSEISEFKTNNKDVALQIITRQIQSPLLQFVIEGQILNKFSVIADYFNEDEEYIVNVNIMFSLLYDLSYINNGNEYELEDFDVEHYHYESLRVTEDLADYIKSEGLLTYLYEQGPDLGIDEDLYQEFKEEHLPVISKMIEI